MDGTLESILGARPQVKVTPGEAAAMIQGAAEEGPEPTLVAVGRRGLGAVRHFAVSSVFSEC